MKAVQNKQTSSNKTTHQLKPQSNQNAKITDNKQSVQKNHLSPQKISNDLNTIKDGSKLSESKNQNSIKDTIQTSLNQKVYNQSLPNSSSHKNLSGEQNQRIQNLSKVNFQQLFASKKLYKPITLLNQNFTQSIGKGIISINQQKQGLKDFNKESICFKKLQKQNDQIQLEQAIRIKEIQRKKNQILVQLKSLYQDQQKLRAKQKFILLKKKAQHQFISNHNNQQYESLRSSPKKTKITNTQSPKSSIQTKKIQLKSKSLPRSVFTQEQKKTINQIIKKKNQLQIKQKQKLQKMFNQLEQEQKQLLEKEKLTIEAQRQKRKKQALQRLVRHKNSRTEFIMNSRKNIHTQPNQVKDNEFFISNLNEQTQNKSLSRLNYSPKKNYSYLNYKLLDQQKLKQQAEKSRFLLKKRKQQTKIDFQQIKVHLNNYRSIKTQQSQIEKQKIQNFKLQQKQRIKSIRQKYGFMTKIKETLLEQERDSIQKYQKQISRKINYQKRMKEYFHSIHHKPKLRCRSNLVENRSNKANSECNLRIQSSKNLYQNEESFQVRKRVSSNKQIKLQEQKNLTRDQEYLLKIDKEKLFLSETLELQKISHDALTKRKIELKESIKKKQKEMMKILKKDQSSLQDIKKALQIFHQLDSQIQSQNNQKRKSHNKQVAW